MAHDTGHGDSTVSPGAPEIEFEFVVFDIWITTNGVLSKLVGIQLGS